MSINSDGGPIERSKNKMSNLFNDVVFEIYWSVRHKYYSLKYPSDPKSILEEVNKVQGATAVVRTRDIA